MKIATHNGKFHADEVFAVSLLRRLDRFKDAEIIRTRDAEILKTADVVVDVGGQYDPLTHRYDHHQPEFKDSFSPKFKTLLSSAGLVYKHFGKEILKARGPALSDSQIDALYEHVYESFVEAFDANDNGISAYPSDIKPAFARPFDIFWHVNLFNPPWNAPEVTPQMSNESFMKAVELVSSAFDLYLSGCIDAWLPARDLVVDALAAKKVADASLGDLEGILLLPTSCPWKDHLFEQPEVESIYYVVYPEGANASYRIQAVPENPDSFVSKLPLPQEWLGLRDSELDAVTGDEVEDGAIFVHRSGFIGGHKTQSGALAMARVALKMNKRSKTE